MPTVAKVPTLNADSSNAIEVRDLTKYYGRPGLSVRRGRENFWRPSACGKSGT